jgi:hypothetical protein
MAENLPSKHETEALNSTPVLPEKNNIYKLLLVSC